MRTELPEDLGVVLEGIRLKALAPAGLREQLSERRQSGGTGFPDNDALACRLTDVASRGSPHARKDVAGIAVEVNTNAGHRGGGQVAGHVTALEQHRLDVAASHGRLDLEVEDPLV